MRRPPRWLLLLAAIILTLLVLAPFAIGRLIADQLPQAIEQMDQSVGHYEVTLSPLRSGWLTTAGALSVSRADGRAVLRYPFKLRHGLITPTPAWIRGNGELLNPTDEAMGELSFRLSVTGKMVVNLQLTELSGFEGQLSFTQSLRSGRWALTSHGFSGSNFQDLKGQLDNAADGSFQLDLTVQEMSGDNWALGGIQSRATVTPAQQFVDLSIESSASFWQRPGMAPFTHASAKTTLNHLSLPVLTQALQLRDATSTLALLPALLQGQPVIESLALNFDHPLGSAEADLSARLTQPPPAGFVGDFRRILPVVALQAQWNFSEALALAWTQADYEAIGANPIQAEQQARSRWDQIRQTGWVQADGNRLVGTTELDRDVLTVNGVEKLRE